MTSALYPGSFDPFTLGHLHIVQQAATLFDEVYVGVAHNESKKPYLPIDVRINLAQQAVGSNASVRSLDGLTVVAAKELGVNTIVRGLRDRSDFYEEERLRKINYLLEPTIPTIYLPCPAALEQVSSSLVRGLMDVDQTNIDKLVPQNVAEYLRGVTC